VKTRLLTTLVLGSLSLWAAEEEALAVSAIIQARHVPFGAIMDPVFATPESDEIVSYTRCGDSALWTGHYVAAEAFRYKVTGSMEALDNMKRGLAAIKGLLDVTGNNLLARCMFRKDWQHGDAVRNEESVHGIYTNEGAGWHWIGNTSRDQYSGVMFGLAVAYDAVEDEILKGAIRAMVTRVVDYLRGNNWTVWMPNGDASTTFLARPDQMLAFVQIARHVNPDRFSTYYDVQRVVLITSMLAPIRVEIESDDSYFKFNLDYINLYSLMRLESSSFGDVYREAYDLLRGHTAPHQNAFFNMIDFALTGPNADRDAETLALLDGWLERQRRDHFVHLGDQVESCGDRACAPVPIKLRPPTDFVWQRNPFQLWGGLHGTIETAGIDYILPYWMSRYYRLQ